MLAARSAAYRPPMMAILSPLQRLRQKASFVTAAEDVRAIEHKAPGSAVWIAGMTPAAGTPGSAPPRIPRCSID